MELLAKGLPNLTNLFIGNSCIKVGYNQLGRKAAEVIAKGIRKLRKLELSTLELMEVITSGSWVVG